MNPSGQYLGHGNLLAGKSVIPMGGLDGLGSVNERRLTAYKA